MTARALLVDRDALAEAERAGDVLGANDDPDGRVLHRRARRPRATGASQRGLPADPMTRVSRERLPGAASSPTRRRRRRPAGARDDAPDRRTSCSPGRTGSAPIRGTPTTPAATPRPRAPTSTRSPATDVELLWVKGSGGDLGTLTEAGSRGAAARPAARAGRRVPRRGARGRDGRGVRLLPARQGRRGAVDRHRDARPRRRAARRPSASRQRHRDRDRRRRRAADQGDLRRQGRVGAVAAPRVPARARHRRDQGSATRRRSACILGGHGITAWGDTSDEAEAQLAVDHRHRAGLHRRARRARAVRSGRRRIRRRCPTDERRAKAAALAPHAARASPRTTSRMVGHFTDADVVLDFLAGEKLFALAALGTVVPRPLPAHQGQAAGARPARRRADRGVRSPG